MEDRDHPTPNLAPSTGGGGSTAADSSTSPLAAVTAAAHAAALAHGSNQRPASVAGVGDVPNSLPFHPLDRAAHLAAGNGVHHIGEHEARVEAMQVKRSVFIFKHNVLENLFQLECHICHFFQKNLT